MGSRFGVGAPPIVYFSGDWDVHYWGYGRLTHGKMSIFDVPLLGVKGIYHYWTWRYQPSGSLASFFGLGGWVSKVHSLEVKPLAGDLRTAQETMVGTITFATLQGNSKQQDVVHPQ